MKKEKVVLAFIAALIGLLVAGIAFYLYQSTKVVSPSKLKTSQVASPTPTPTSENFLTANQPKDEDVVNKKVVIVSGKTSPDATVVMLTSLDQQVVNPSTDGDFSTTVNIDDGENVIEITAALPNGQQSTVKRTVTFSTEEF